MIIIESIILMHQVALVYHTISSVAKCASTFKGSVREYFENCIKTDKKEFLSFAKDRGNRDNIKYYRNFDELVGGSCLGDESNAAIAEFSIRYKAPIFIITRFGNNNEYINSKMVLMIRGYSFVSLVRENDLFKNEKGENMGFQEAKVDQLYGFVNGKFIF